MALSSPLANHVATHGEPYRTSPMPPSHGRFRLLLIQDHKQPIAIDDLASGGFPANAEVLLLTLPALFRSHPYHENQTKSEIGSTGFLKLELAARQTRTALLAAFPLWDVETAVSSRSDQVVIAEASRWQPDLIVFGAMNATAHKSRAFRSLLRKLVTECHFPIRVTRANSQIWSFLRPALIAFDGADSAAAILTALRNRRLAKGSDVKLLFCAEPLNANATTSSDGFAEPRREWIAEQLVQTKIAIEAMGHKVSSVALVGNTAQAILDEARRADAEAILIGKGSKDVLSDLVAQSVAATVAANAACSVEIICGRPQTAGLSQAIAA